MKMIDPLPCPFCGCEAEVLTFWEFYKFSCKNVDCTAHVADAPYVQHAEGVWYGSIDEARAAWNTRTERVDERQTINKIDDSVIDDRFRSLFARYIIDGIRAWRERRSE